MEITLSTINSTDTLWAQAFQAWLGSLAANTQLVYQDAWRRLLIHSDAMPWNITRAAVFQWEESMRSQGLSTGTINLRVTAISSFFRYAGSYYILNPNGSEAPLFSGENPAIGKLLRPRRRISFDARYLGVEECQALLRAIRRCSGVQARRDYALVLAYLVMGRRNSEIRLLRWGDIETKDGKTFYRWSGKGKRDVRTEMPAICAQAIRDYLLADGRAAPDPSEYIFLAVNDNARRLPKGTDWQSGDPLSARQVGKLVKKYAALAGLNPEFVHVHTLRHSAAMLRQSAGDSFGQIQTFLAHSKMSTTQIYLHNLVGNGDSSWGKVADLLGINEAKSNVTPQRRRSKKRA